MRIFDYLRVQPAIEVTQTIQYRPIATCFEEGPDRPSPALRTEPLDLSEYEAVPTGCREWKNPNGDVIHQTHYRLLPKRPQKAPEGP